MHKNILIFVALLFFFSLAFLFMNKPLIDKGEMDSDWDDGVVIMPKSQAELEAKWDFEKGSWGLLNGKLESLGPGTTDKFLVFKKGIPGDIAFEFDAQIPNEESLKRGADLSSVLASTKSLLRRYDIQLGNAGNTKGIVQMIDIPLASVPFVLEVGTVYHIRVEKNGDYIRLFCDQKLLIETKNKYFLNGSFFGLYTYGFGNQFWNLKLFRKKSNLYISPVKLADLLFSNALTHPFKNNPLFSQARLNYLNLLSKALTQEEKNKILFRLCFLEKEMGRFDEAQKFMNQIVAEQDNQYELLSMRFELALFDRNKDVIIDLYTKIFQDYPVYKEDLSGILKSFLFLRNKAFLSKELEVKIWDLYLQNSNSKDFVGSGLYLKNIDFLKAYDFSSVSLINNEIEDISALEGMKSLNDLGLNNNKITDIEALLNKPIKRLSIKNNPIKNIDALKGMPLSALSMDSTFISDISVLKGMNTLTKINLSNTKVVDLSPLKNLELKGVNCASLGLGSIDDLPLESIEELHCSNNKLKNINALRSKKLNILDVSNNLISSLDEISKLNLKILNISLNPIVSLKPYYSNPPKYFSFNCKTIPEKELNYVIDRWSPDPKKKSHVQYAKTILALRQKEIKSLKKIAVPFNNHLYLYIPEAKTHEDALRFCEELGAHLVTITSLQENKFVNELPGFMSKSWIGLVCKDRLFSWINEEFLYFVRVRLGDTTLLYPNANFMMFPNSTKPWEPIKSSSGAKHPFIIEWDR